jgi:hypothetical protein
MGRATMIGVLPAEPNFARIDAALLDAPLTRLVGIGDALLHAPWSTALWTNLDRWLGDPRPEIRRWALEIVGARAEPGKEREVVNCSEIRRPPPRPVALSSGFRSSTPLPCSTHC